jgi:hypothetical protein
LQSIKNEGFQAFFNNGNHPIGQGLDLGAVYVNTNDIVTQLG